MRLAERKRTGVSCFPGNYTDPRARLRIVNKRLALYIIKASVQINLSQLLDIVEEQACPTVTCAFLLYTTCQWLYRGRKIHTNHPSATLISTKTLTLLHLCLRDQLNYT